MKTNKKVQFESFVMNEFDCYVIYGWYKDLNQWHIFAIIPVNGTFETISDIKNLAACGINLAYGQSKVCYQNKGSSIPVFIEE